MQHCLILTRQANSASDDSRVGVSPTTLESDSVSEAEFDELLDRLLAVRKCAVSAPTKRKIGRSPFSRRLAEPCPGPNNIL